MAAESAHNPPVERDLLDPSELGTREYWDALYDREVRNYDQDNDDEGTIWFSESNAEEIVLRELDKLEDSGLLHRRSNVSPDLSKDGDLSRFLDLGTGNGHMLFLLRSGDGDEDLGWHGEMIGVDYSESSVQLARRIAAQSPSSHDDASTSSPLRFECWDLLSQAAGEWLAQGFDVVLDKGTFDAISLMPRDGVERHPCEIYREKVAPLVKEGKFLFVTSCNWTREELLGWLAPERGELEFFAEAKYPQFRFGGKTGQSVVTVIFRKRN